MAFWRRKPRPRDDGPARRDDEERTWLDQDDPLAHTYSPLYGPGEVPQAYEPKGPAELFEDEIDPEWRDEWTAED